MQDNPNLFISESSIGYHYNKAIEETLKSDFLSFTFYPVITTEIFDDINDVKLKYSSPVIYNFEKIHHQITFQFAEDIVSYILSLKKKYIFIGFDLDETGELMASVLNYALIKNGFNAENIFRMPLCDFGYDFTEIGLSEFYSYDKTMEILKFIQREQKLISVTGQGFRKNFILKELLYKITPKTEFQKLNNYTNTLTYVTKFILNEKK